MSKTRRLPKVLLACRASRPNIMGTLVLGMDAGDGNYRYCKRCDDVKQCKGPVKYVRAE